jgi:ribosome biogenesis protein BRX1
MLKRKQKMDLVTENPNVPDADEEEVIKEKGMKKYLNKQRILIICSRGITVRQRHLFEDFKKLLPHHKTDSKLDTKGDIQVVNEVAELQSCNQILYLEARKHQDLYMLLGKTPHGPSVKFLVVNIHTMDELKLTGNCLNGSRPILNFDANFNKNPQFQLMKSLLRDAFGTPHNHPKSKPFVDRIMSFFVVKNDIWVRNYQIIDRADVGKKEEKILVEIGPRFVLVPIRVFNGCFSGATLYENSAYVSPNEERAAMKMSKEGRFVERKKAKIDRIERQNAIQLSPDPLDSRHVFKGAPEEGNGGESD